MDVVVEQVRAQLRIEDLSGEDRESQDQKDGDDGDEEVGDNQPVAEAPEKPRSPPAGKTKDRVDGCKDSEELQEARKVAAEAENGTHRAADNQQDCEEVNPREAAPNVSEFRRQSGHWARDRRNTVPEEGSGAQWKRAAGSGAWSDVLEFA